MCSPILRKCVHADLRFYALGVLLFSLVTFVYFMVRLRPSGDISSPGNDSIVSAPPSDGSLPAPTERPGLLLVLIHASGRGYEVRDAIRNSWVSTAMFKKVEKDLGHQMDYRFVLGVQDIPGELLSNLTQEARVHKDMLLLDNVSDQHESLSYRTLRSFQYVSRELNKFLYVFKCDDDSFANLLAVGRELADRKTHRAHFWGQFLGAGGIITEGPYSEHRWSVCDTYFPYALGGGYVLSMDLVNLVAANAPHLMVYNNEDVSLAAWLAPYNINLVFDARFNTGAVTKGCKKPYIVMHRVSVKQMHDYFAAVMSEGIICNKKNRKFVWHGYMYNWKVDPSKCCRIRKRVP